MPIVTIPDGVTGPALQTTQIINAKWDNAVGWFEDAINLSNNTVADVGSAPVIPMPSIDRNGITLPVPPSSLPTSNPDEAMAYFDAKNAEISALIDGAFQQILGIAFPDMGLMSAAMDWCMRSITEGGSGIKTSVEAALWERGRSRILKQAERDMSATQEKYARAGWPLPPGAMLRDTAMIRQDSRDKLAEQSRDIAIKSFDAELENVRMSVKMVGDQFTQALQAVGDYVKTIMLGPQVAAGLTSTVSGLKNEAARTLLGLYQAQNAAIEPLIRMNITDAELRQRAHEANSRATTEAAQLRVQTVLSNVKMVGDAAAASLNGINAGVSNTMSSSVAL